MVGLYQEQMSCGADIVNLSTLFFSDELQYDEEAKEVLAGEHVPAVVQAFKEALAEMSEWSAEQIKAAIKVVQKATGQKGKNLFMPIRVATTGQTHILIYQKRSSY